jgi:hypothetical protein
MASRNSTRMEIVTESRKKSELAPRSLGISAPLGKDVYEVYVKLKSKTAGMGKLMEIIASQNAEVLSVHSNYSSQDGLCHLILYLEMCEAKTKIAPLLSMLKCQEFVVGAIAESKAAMHFESMLFPILRGGSYRVFVLGANEWVHLLEAFAAKFGTAAAAVLHEQGVSIGETMAEQLEDRFRTRPSADVLERDFVGLIRAGGMGRLKISGTRFGFVVRIEEAVVSESERGIIDNFLVGVVTGALGRIHSSNYAVSDLSQSRDFGISFCLTPIH